MAKSESNSKPKQIRITVSHAVELKLKALADARGITPSAMIALLVYEQQRLEKEIVQ